MYECVLIKDCRDMFDIKGEGKLKRSIVKKDIYYQIKMDEGDFMFGVLPVLNIKKTSDYMGI